MSELTGKVAIITGAGRGLGRVEALELARQGARVVINEIGLPAAREAAESVREEIVAFGGEAITVYGDCADWNDSEALFKTALDTWGDVNILVNNAGFCRDKMIFSMSEEEFDSVVRVHLKGHFVNTRHAAAYWREKAKSSGGQLYGRLISTSSEAFLYGSVGQPNYASAKAGIVALTMGAAQALIKYGVTANVIMPRARTDMTMGGGTAQLFAKPQEGFDEFDPVNVAPFVGYLASPRAQRISGYVFVVWGRQVTMVEGPKLGAVFESEEQWTMDTLDRQLSPHFEQLRPILDGFAVIPGQ
ncbi:MAG: SDR family NAD(P)-dependent oxidoreductase [Gammaproteobacteria bacterium]|nr:SDR family NAD(P)-dependent oxidoreductase [Gammaproteobacteria bacterium]